MFSQQYNNHGFTLKPPHRETYPGKLPLHSLEPVFLHTMVLTSCAGWCRRFGFILYRRLRVCFVSPRPASYFLLQSFRNTPLVSSNDANTTSITVKPLLKAWFNSAAVIRDDIKFFGNIISNGIRTRVSTRARVTSHLTLPLGHAALKQND